MSHTAIHIPAQRNLLLKIILLGDSGVGKTSLLQRYSAAKFSDKYQATIGADFITKEILLDGKRVVLQIWDTAGQERFQSLGTAFYRGADACVMVYDVTRPNSLAALEQWKDEFLIQACPRDPESFPFVIIGNKIDLVDIQQPCPQRPKLWFDDNPSIVHIYASAKSALNVGYAFETAAKLNMAREASFPDTCEHPDRIDLEKRIVDYDEGSSCNC